MEDHERLEQQREHLFKRSYTAKAKAHLASSLQNSIVRNILK